MYIYDYSLTMIDFVDWLSSKERVFFSFFYLSSFCLCLVPVAYIMYILVFFL